MVVQDREWGGKDAAEIRSHIRHNLVRNGWQDENVDIVVIEPELEMWLWQDTPLIAQVFNNFNHQPFTSLRKWMENEGWWLSTDLKPVRPKEAFEMLARRAKLPRSGALYQKIAEQISVRRCTDPTFRQLRETLQRWFPEEIEVNGETGKY